MNESHAFATATHRCFQHDRITDLVTQFYGFFHAFQVLLCSRNYRYTRFCHFDTGGYFVSHCFHGFRFRTDENNAFFAAATGKCCILGQETVSGMDRVCMA